MIEAIMSFIAVLTSFACMLSSFAFGDFAGSNNPNDAEACKLNFSVISDTHMFDDYGKQGILEMGLADMQSYEPGLDALIISGDITNNAKSVQWARVADAFSKYDPADNIILAQGNHDTWNKEVDEENRFPESERLFLEYNKIISGREINKVYYSTEVNGYTFIVIGSEDDTTKGYVSNEQFAWFEAELLKASLKGLPIFVVSHWTLDNTHGTPNVWFDNPSSQTPEELADHDSTYANGRSAEMQAAMEKYDNVIYITGHLHNGIADNYNSGPYSYSTVEKIGSITSVNLPSYGNTAVRGAPSMGMGITFEVYENEIVLKPRCYSAGVWYTNDFFTISLAA